jgi:uncharacterized protein
MYLPRTLERFFMEAERHFPVLLVTGPRQVGKTTFLQRLSTGERTYVTLDDPRVRSLATDDPGLFLQRFRPPVLIDEIQYAPDLLAFIKMEVDREHKPGMFWLTGSQQFHLMKGVSESLAGRVGVVNLLGLSRRELMGHSQDTAPFLPTEAHIGAQLEGAPPLALNELYRRIWRGSLPAIALDDAMNRDLFYSSYVQTYLQRDLQDLAQVGDTMTFLRFLRAAAARTGQLLNVADMARDADVAPNTAKSWLGILQASGIIYLLEPYHTNVTKRLVKSPKLFFLDTGLAAWLTEWSSPQTLEAGASSGAMLETWVVAEILKSYWHNGQRAPLHFYRDKDCREIDLLVVRDGTAHPLEIKKTAAPGRDSIRHFGALGRLGLPIGPGGVICLSERPLPMTESVWVIPVAAL